MTMIDQIADALAKADNKVMPRAALEALREPSTDMMVMLTMHVADSLRTGQFGVEEATKAWQAAIDVALE